jgi:hypothetical protein
MIAGDRFDNRGSLERRDDVLGPLPGQLERFRELRKGDEWISDQSLGSVNGPSARVCLPEPTKRFVTSSPLPRKH